MKCRHPKCFAFLRPEDALYPELAAMEKALGRKVVEADIDNFAFHRTHSPGFDRASTVFYLTTFYVGIVPTTKPQKAASAPTPRRPREVVYNQAIAIRHRYGLELEATLEAANRYRTSGKSLEQELAIQRMIEGRRRKLAARAAVKQAATDSCAA